MSAHRWSVASRIAAAVVGGYGFTTLLVIALSVLLTRFGINEAQALFGATTASFLIYALVIMAVFYARTAMRAWIGLALCSLIPGLIVAALGTGAAG